MPQLSVVALTKAAFRPFGDVVELNGADEIVINEGFASRVNGLARIDVAAGGGLVNVSLFTVKPRSQPIAIAMMERHPLGSQLFQPLQDKAWLVVVCADPRDGASYRAFVASGRQGVNYARNVWHHPVLAGDGDRFLVVDRGGGGDNLEESWLETGRSMHLDWPPR